MLYHKSIQSKGEKTMKKYLCLFLAILMILSLCACSGSDAAKETTAATEATVEEAKPQLEIGYGKVNITPSYSVGLSSSGDEKNRRSTGLISYVFATCIAVRFGEDTYLMYTVDTISMPEELMKILRETISSVVPEVKPENIFLAATHTHSAPANAIADNEAEGKYRIDFINYIPQAAKLAIKDLAPATMSACKFDLEGMNFVRHYWAIDGSSAGNNYGNQNIEYKEHTYDVNHEMVLVNFKREGKEDVMMVNWAAHPANPYNPAIGYLNICADHPGWCRDRLEELTGAKVAYFNGASGDVVPDSKVTAINHGLDAKQYGIKLAELAYEHYSELKSVEVDDVKATQQVVQCNVEHEGEHLLVQCMDIQQIRYNVDKATADQMARDIGLSSAYHANAIISRSKMGATDPRTLNAFRIGPIGFTTGTYEMASEHAGELKAQSPFEYTFLMCGNTKYIPREEAIDYQSYEGTNRPYTRETGDMLVGKYVEMLNSIK